MRDRDAVRKLFREVQDFGRYKIGLSLVAISSVHSKKFNL